MTRHLSPIAVAAALVAIAGCSSDDDANQPAATAAAKRSAAPYGTYVRRVTRSDLDRTAGIRDESGPAQELPGTGEYRLVIAQGAAQDVLKTTGPDGFTIAMDLESGDGEIKTTSYVDPSKASFCGPEVAAFSRYAFDVADGTLSLKPSAPDPCADRDSVLTGTWKKG